LSDSYFLFDLNKETVMYKTLIWCSSAMVAAAALVVIVTVAAAASPQEHPAVTNMQPQTLAAVVTPTEVPVQPEALPSEEEAKVEQLADYVLGAMNFAVKPDENSASYESVAHDIAEVVSDPKEPPIWKEDSTKARTAIMLVSIAFWETSFRSFVDEGKCNDKAWRASPEGQEAMRRWGTCDGGIARSIWQIHAEHGITVVPANYDDESQELSKREWCYSSECGDDDGGTIISPEAMVSDRKNAARVALHMARRSIRNNAHLCQFTGEGGLGDDGCPKGEIRYDWAEGPKGYSRKHPFSFVKLVEE
jgi:hypothetical protein